MNSAVRATAGVPAATRRMVVARPASNWRAVEPQRTSVPGPARSAFGLGKAVPVSTTSKVIRVSGRPCPVQVAEKCHLGTVVDELVCDMQQQSEDGRVAVSVADGAD